MVLNFKELLFQGVSTNQQAENWRKVSEKAELEMQARREGNSSHENMLRLSLNGSYLMVAIIMRLPS